MVKKIFSGILISLLTPVLVLAAGASSNTGFVSGPVWFSDTSPDTNINTIAVYTAIFNDEDSVVDFSIALTDNNITVQNKKVSVQSKETKTVSFDWNVGKGKHTFVALITEASKNDIALDISKNKTSSASLSIGDSVSIPTDVGPKSVKFLESINFRPDSTEAKAKDWLVDSINSAEAWRIAKSDEIKVSLTKVKSEREKMSDAKPAVKGTSFIHMWGLMIVGFVLSIGILFYLISFVLIIWVVKKFFQILRFIFHKRER